MSQQQSLVAELSRITGKKSPDCSTCAAAIWVLSWMELRKRGPDVLGMLKGWAQL
jgi:hypothetical protein